MITEQVSKPRPLACRSRRPSALGTPAPRGNFGSDVEQSRAIPSPQRTPVVAAAIQLRERSGRP